jgi:hypothetical protein
MPLGDIRTKICDALVSYQFDAGWYAQVDPEGPAILFYEAHGWDPDLSVGDVVDVRATHITEFHGLLEVTEHEPVVVKATGRPTEHLIQDLSEGIAPSEDLESELVRVQGVLVVGIDGRNITVSYGGLGGIVLRSHRDDITCAGARLDLLAVVTEWNDADQHRLQIYADGDITRQDDRGCAAGGEPRP